MILTESDWAGPWLPGGLASDASLSLRLRSGTEFLDSHSAAPQEHDYFLPSPAIGLTGCTQSELMYITGDSIQGRVFCSSFTQRRFFVHAEDPPTSGLRTQLATSSLQLLQLCIAVKVTQIIWAVGQRRAVNSTHECARSRSLTSNVRCSSDPEQSAKSPFRRRRDVVVSTPSAIVRQSVPNTIMVESLMKVSSWKTAVLIPVVPRREP